jgi:hypothetical protein
MTTTFNRIRIFKWKAGLTFFGTFAASLGGAFTTSSAATTWQNWAVASLIAFGVACTTTLALFVQVEKQLDAQPADNDSPKSTP